MKPIIGVFEGGGVRGIALAGAAAATLDAGYRFERVVGTSAGALVGSLVMAGYAADELRGAVCKIDWPGLLDRPPVGRIPGLGKHISVFFNSGLYLGDALEATWADLLAAKGVTTFADLGGVLRVVATDLSHTRGVVFPDVLAVSGYRLDEFTVARAVRISASVPFVFRPVEFRDRNTGDVALMSDGAMAANFPIRVVDPDANIPAVGFRFRPLTDHPHVDIRGPISFAAAVIRSGIGAREGLPALRSSLVDVLDIPAQRDGLDFNLTPAEAREMFDTAHAAVARQLMETPLTVG